MNNAKTAVFGRARSFRLGTLLILTVLMLFVAVARVPTYAQTYSVLYSFSGGADGASPSLGSLFQGADGNFYGTTSAGGTHGSGTVFKITPSGKLTTIYGFCAQTGCADGKTPNGRLVQADDGNLYGTTNTGGANGYGTVFRLTRGGALTTLYSFCAQTNCADGEYPTAGLIQAIDGNLYGTTFGINIGNGCNTGTIFKITPEGVLTTLHSFAGGPTDGGCPNAELIQATNGKFYGTTEYGGPGYEGTVFKITSAGVLTTLYGFYQDDGGWPSGGVVQDAGGNLYGTTFGGGLYLYGTVFKLTPSGTLTGLHNFCAQGWPDCADGFYPDGGLVQATDGNFYGTTLDGGANQDGTVFEITAGGTLITLYAFCTQANCTDGRYPHAGLLQATNGNLYGTTSNGGAKDSGTVFSLSMGLAPFVETLPTLGRVGSRIIILGTDLTGATGVSFNGTAATYTVASSTKIKTTVPPGATTGLVTVITPTGTLNSNSLFRVTPRILSFSPSSGPIGTPVVITGTSFTQVEKVAFGGVAATSFTVDSDTQVTAIVPVGALTGRIRIKTLGGARWSATEFTVTP